MEARQNVNQDSTDQIQIDFSNFSDTEWQQFITEALSAEYFALQGITDILNTLRLALIELIKDSTKLYIVNSETPTLQTIKLNPNKLIHSAALKALKQIDPNADISNLIWTPDETNETLKKISDRSKQGALHAHDTRIIQYLIGQSLEKLLLIISEKSIYLTNYLTNCLISHPSALPICTELNNLTNKISNILSSKPINSKQQHAIICESLPDIVTNIEFCLFNINPSQQYTFKKLPDDLVNLHSDDLKKAKRRCQYREASNKKTKKAKGELNHLKFSSIEAKINISPELSNQDNSSPVEKLQEMIADLQLFQKTISSFISAKRLPKNFLQELFDVLRPISNESCIELNHNYATKLEEIQNQTKSKDSLSAAISRLNRDTMDIAINKVINTYYQNLQIIYSTRLFSLDKSSVLSMLENILLILNDKTYYGISKKLIALQSLQNSHYKLLPPIEATPVPTNNPSSTTENMHKKEKKKIQQQERRKNKQCLNDIIADEILPDIKKELEELLIQIQIQNSRHSSLAHGQTPQEIDNERPTEETITPPVAFDFNTSTMKGLRQFSFTQELATINLKRKADQIESDPFNQRPGLSYTLSEED